jgi:hypothetical protein
MTVILAPCATSASTSLRPRPRLPSVTPTIRTILIEKGLPQGQCAWRRSGRGRASAHLPEAIRRKAKMWLARELISWRAQFQPKMTQPTEFRLK